MKKEHGFVFAIAFSIVLAVELSAQAGEYCNYLGRHIGMGWSDGYHADDVHYAQQGNFNYAPSTSTCWLRPPADDASNLAQR